MTKKEPAEGSTPQEAPPLNIHQAMAHILAEIGPIAKKKENLEQGYRFRGIDAAMDALNPLMAKYGVFPTTKDIETVIYETVTSAKGKSGYHVIRKYTFAFNSIDGTSVDTKFEGEAIDYGDKAIAKAQSVAFRECLYKTFVAPFEASIIDPQGSLDTEDQDHDLKPANPRAATPAAGTAYARPYTPPAKKATPPVQPTKPETLCSPYGIRKNKELWENYWMIKMSVRKGEKDEEGNYMWTGENMWKYFESMLEAVFGTRHIEEITVKQSIKLEDLLKQKLDGIIAEEAVMRAKGGEGSTKFSQKVVHNPPAPGKTQSSTNAAQASRA